MSEAGQTSIGKNYKRLETSPQDTYSKVTINVNDEISYSVGDDTGRELTAEIPWGTPQMAQTMLDSLWGYQYKPYELSGAYIEPAAELGDAISIDGFYAGLYEQDTAFGRLYKSDARAPQMEALEDVAYKSKAERRYERKFERVESEFIVQADEISAKVSKTGGSESSFGWNLVDDAWRVYANGNTILEATKSGLAVTGEIRAISGYIGSAGKGFTIMENAIYNGVLSMDDNAHYGVYVGTDGIALGKGAFRVDSYGRLYAESGTFRGAVSAGNIKYGGNDGSFNGAGLTSGSVSGGYGGAISGGSLSTFNMNGGVNQSLGYADYAYSVFNGWIRASMVSAERVWAATYFQFGAYGDQYAPGVITFKDGDGVSRRYTVLMKRN